MNKKFLTVIVVLVIITAIIFFVLQFIGGKNQDQTPAQHSGNNASTTGSGTWSNGNVDQNPFGNGNQETGGGQGATQQTILLNTSSGGSVTARNFIADRDLVRDTINTQQTYLNNYDPTVITGPSVQPTFIISYTPSTQYFNIVLNSEPIGNARAQAEQYLMNKLGLTQEQICSLNYMVSVPGYVNKYYSGESLGFSFCPGSVPLGN